MGRGGVDPDYFMHRMKWYEVRLYADGMWEREHAGWMQNRKLIYYMLIAGNVKKENGRQVAEEDIYPLPWLDEKKKQAYQEPDYQERMKALLEDCKAWNEAQGS